MVDRTLMPELIGEDLNDRHNQFLREVRQAIGVGFVKEDRMEEARAKVKAAQEAYAAWFAERGVTLTFREEP